MLQHAKYGVKISQHAMIGVTMLQQALVGVTVLQHAMVRVPTLHHAKVGRCHNVPIIMQWSVAKVWRSVVQF